MIYGSDVVLERPLPKEILSVLGAAAEAPRKLASRLRGPMAAAMLSMACVSGWLVSNLRQRPLPQVPEPALPEAAQPLAQAPQEEEYLVPLNVSQLRAERTSPTPVAGALPIQGQQRPEVIAQPAARSGFHEGAPLREHVRSGGTHLWMAANRAAPRRAETLAGLKKAFTGPVPQVTDERQDWLKLCRRGVARCSTNSLGRAVLVELNGTRWTHLAYDHSLPVPLRNTILVEFPNGERNITIDSPMLVDPLIFDLSGEGVRTTDRLVRYDMRGNGRPVAVHELAPGTAVLVFDANGDGTAGKDGRELFGFDSRIDGRRGEYYIDGFEALAAFVKRAEAQGALESGRTRLDEKDLARLHKRYGLGFRVGGWVTKNLSPKEAGVREIVLSEAKSHRVFNFDGQGNDVVRRSGATFVRTDGSSGSYEDVFYSHDQLRMVLVPSIRSRS
ncbi:MAG: hypothetical protein HYZ75_06515 [Elusimicrobia bacterium]|nr:hypothetical protein [Elusimicrobiota bacterium]